MCNITSKTKMKSNGYNIYASDTIEKIECIKLKDMKYKIGDKLKAIANVTHIFKNDEEVIVTEIFIGLCFYSCKNIKTGLTQYMNEQYLKPI